MEESVYEYQEIKITVEKEKMWRNQIINFLFLVIKHI